MSRYYFNENPQVAHWMGKCAMLQQELDILQEKYGDMLESRDFWRKDSFNADKIMVAAFKRFNSLPWYKKMFYKFKL